MEIVTLNLADLTPYEQNARHHEQEDLEAIKASILEFGFNDPVGIWGDKNIIVEGHGRVMAAEHLGMIAVPCIRLDHLTDEQRRAYALAHNKTAELSGWDFSILDEELEKIQEIDMTAFGFDIPEPEEEGEIVEDMPPDPTYQRCEPGDVWKCGDHTLICGDATDPETVARLVEGNTIDLLLTDPPYNVDVGSAERPHSSNNGVHILNDKKPFDEFVEFLTGALRNGCGHLKPGGAFYIWYAGLHHPEFAKSIENIDEFKLHEQLIWVKSHFVMGRNSDYQWMHECCLYGWKTGAAHYFTNSRAEESVIEDKEVKLSTMKKDELIELCEKLMGRDESTTILRAEKPNAADLHPTVKPQALLTRLIKNSTHPGENVLDLFGGSGSTMIAAEQLGRRCYMAELDPHYCDVILQRWEQFTGKEAVKIGQGTMAAEDQDGLQKGGDI